MDLYDAIEVFGEFQDKTIQFVFADTKLKAVDCFDDIWQAARFAQHNLYFRHGIEIDRPVVTENNFVTMTVHIPNHLVSSFSTGRHMRGISAYLLRKYPDKYKPHLVGTRLLHYVEVGSKEEISETTDAAMVLGRSRGRYLQRKG